MAGIAGLKKDIDHIRTNTNQSLRELRGLLGEWDLGNCPEMGGMTELAHCTNPWGWFTLQSIWMVLPGVEQYTACTTLYGTPCTWPWLWGHSDSILFCLQIVPGSPARRVGSLLRESVTTSPQPPSHGMKPGSSARRIILTWSSSVALLNRWSIHSKPLRISGIHISFPGLDGEKLELLLSH